MGSLRFGVGQGIPQGAVELEVYMAEEPDQRRCHGALIFGGFAPPADDSGLHPPPMFTDAAREVVFLTPSDVHG